MFLFGFRQSSRDGADSPTIGVEFIEAELIWLLLVVNLLSQNLLHLQPIQVGEVDYKRLQELIESDVFGIGHDLLDGYSVLYSDQNFLRLGHTTDNDEPKFFQDLWIDVLMKGSGGLVLV